MMMEMLIPANEPTQNYSEAKKHVSCSIPVVLILISNSLLNL